MADNQITNEVNKLMSLMTLANIRNAGLLNSLSALKQIGEMMSAEVDRMVEEMEENKTLTGSMLTALANLAARLRDVAGDRVRTLELANELDSRNKEIADALVANTPESPT